MPYQQSDEKLGLGWFLTKLFKTRAINEHKEAALEGLEGSTIIHVLNFEGHKILLIAACSKLDVHLLNSIKHQLPILNITLH